MKPLDEWLENIQKTHPKDWDLGLERVGEVARRLDVLHPGITCFLIAGTNGKGSACETLAQLCRATNRSYGKTTSPFFLHYNEQIEINGEAVPDTELVSAFESIAKAADEISLSYFEYGALAAMLLFQQAKVDVAIFEVGLGGRLDAMNVIEPDVSIITRIALDHQDWLGENREAIGFEKAGIMRSNKPVVVMDDDCPTSVLEHAAALNSELRLVGRDFDYGHDQLSVNTRHYSVPQTQLPLPSAIGAVVGFLEAGFEVSQDELTRALEVASLPGRFQIIGNKPVTVMDVCHNPDAAEYLAKKLVQIPDVDEWHFVIGIYRDKDQGGIFHNLSPLRSTWYFCDLPGPRGADAIDLSRVLHETCGLSSQTYDKVSSALDAAIYTVKNAVKNDVELRQGIAILGSFSTVGAALQHLNLDVTEATH